MALGQGKTDIARFQHSKYTQQIVGQQYTRLPYYFRRLAQLAKGLRDKDLIDTWVYDDLEQLQQISLTQVR